MEQVNSQINLSRYELDTVAYRGRVSMAERDMAARCVE